MQTAGSFTGPHPEPGPHTPGHCISATTHCPKLLLLTSIRQKQPPNPEVCTEDTAVPVGVPRGILRPSQSPVNLSKGKTWH